MNLDNDFEDNYSENSFGEFENKFELENKIKNYHYAMRRKDRNYGELPSADIVEQLVMYCIDNQRFDEALDFCNLWLEYYPNSLDAHNSLSYILICLSRFREAIVAADKVLEMSTDDVEGLLHKAMALEGVGNPLDSLEILQKVLLIEPDNEVAKGCIGYTHRVLGNYSEAIEYFEQLIEENPDVAETYAHTASCYNESYNFEKALDYCKKAIDLAPYNENFWYNLGATYTNLNEYQDAIDAYMMTLTINEKSFPALIAIAKTYSELDDDDKSIEYFRQALILKPNDSATLINYSSVIANSGDFVQAINILQMALQHSPLNFQAFVGLGVCYHAIGNNKKALEYFNKALKLKPDCEDILFIKADLLFDSKRFKESAKIFEKLLEEAEGNLLYLFYLGRCFYSEQDYEKASLYFHSMLRSCRITSNNREIISNSFFWIAKTYAKQQDYEGSTDMLIQAFELMEERRLDYLFEFPDLLEKKYSRFNKMLQKREKERKKVIENRRKKFEK
jgi:tetratricopeptide (TPR) repeat protein